MKMNSRGFGEIFFVDLFRYTALSRRPAISIAKTPRNRSPGEFCTLKCYIMIYRHPDHPDFHRLDTSVSH